MVKWQSLVSFFFKLVTYEKLKSLDAKIQNAKVKIQLKIQLKHKNNTGNYS